MRAAVDARGGIDPRIDRVAAPVTGGALFVAVFLACVVEAVEAVTIVLAAGVSRQWRPALVGVAVALVVLAAIVAVLGPALTVLPLSDLRLVIGGLLLVFGLQWIRKAILRASGYQALHDEGEIYRTTSARAAAVPGSDHNGAFDWYAFTLSFKGVLLEGLEVVFIVLTFGGSQRDVPLAATAAGAAAVLVAAAGALARVPLARVPENAMKFVVGVMLTGFGAFWSVEGAGARWPGGDAALLVLVPALAVFALGLVAVLRRRRRHDRSQGEVLAS